MKRMLLIPTATFQTALQLFTTIKNHSPSNRMNKQTGLLAAIDVFKTIQVISAKNSSVSLSDLLPTSMFDN